MTQKLETANDRIDLLEKRVNTVEDHIAEDKLTPALHAVVEDEIDERIGNYMKDLNDYALQQIVKHFPELTKDRFGSTCSVRNPVVVMVSFPKVLVPENGLLTDSRYQKSLEKNDFRASLVNHLYKKYVANLVETALKKEQA